VEANRIADIIDLLAGLCDSGTLTGVGIHAAADATNTIAVAADATDQSTANTLLNAMRDGTGEAGGGVAAHYVIVGSSEHIGADVTNVIAAAAATDLATSITLVNELKLDTNAHMLLNAATGHYGPDLANTIISPDATDLASVIVLANEIKAKYNLHCANISAGGLTSVVDNGAFTTNGSLVGSTITFAAATTTAALRGLTRTITAHTNANHLLFHEALPTAPVIGDTWTLAFSVADAEIAVLRQGRGTGGMGPDPYKSGPNILNSMLKMLELLGSTRGLPDTGTTDGAGATTTLVTSGMGATVDAYNNLWAYADDAGALDVDNLRRILDTAATTITAKSAFTVVAGTPTAPGSGTAWEVRTNQIYSGTAAAGAASTLTCPSSIDFAVNELAGLELVIKSGTGVGQRRTVASNTAGVSSVITVTEAWTTNPDSSSVFELQSNVIPAYVRGAAGVAAAQPAGLSSPHGGGNGAYGHPGAALVVELVQQVRNAVEAYTVPT
jgi:hypothetical protein